MAAAVAAGNSFGGILKDSDDLMAKVPGANGGVHHWKTVSDGYDSLIDGDGYNGYYDGW